MNRRELLFSAFFANLRWDEVNRRYERALAMSRAAS
jgi:hypothetical protein